MASLLVQSEFQERLEIQGKEELRMVEADCQTAGVSRAGEQRKKVQSSSVGIEREALRLLDSIDRKRPIKANLGGQRNDVQGLVPLACCVGEQCRISGAAPWSRSILASRWGIPGECGDLLVSPTV